MERNNVRITRHFHNISPEELWNAWTDPEKVILWFGSDPNGTVSSAELNVRLDGGFEVTFRNSDGQSFTCFGKYLEIIENKRLTFTWSWKNNPLIIEKLSIEFTSFNGGTDLKLNHSEIDESTSHDYEKGWNSTFDKLEKVLVKTS